MRPKQILRVFQILSFGHSTQTLWATLAPQTQTGGSMSRRRYPSCRSASPNRPLMQPLRNPSRQSCPPGFAHRECLFSTILPYLLLFSLLLYTIFRLFLPPSSFSCFPPLPTPLSNATPKLPLIR